MVPHALCVKSVEVAAPGKKEVLRMVTVAVGARLRWPPTAAAGTCWTAEKAKTTSTAARLTSEKRCNIFS